MIEDKIKLLRKAAQVSTTESAENVWCVIVGNKEVIDTIVYEVMSLKENVKILLKRKMKLNELFITRKFNLMVLYGEESQIRELSLICKEIGGLALKIAPYHVKNNSNLVLIVGLLPHVKKYIGKLEDKNIKFSIILREETSSFIDTDVRLLKYLPNFVKDILDPLFKVTDVLVSTILLSIDKKDFEKIDEIKSKDVFVLKFREIMGEK
ncbi:conserved hypothetical protein [Methanothermus fervidus DSM 2088]|uniref:Uncharacterized protein n=1 Tax=Methanothermus fervidus (strain ATCC 43054 / DSM 2088 / JCM 10308 / V24 S) TaxID=523846 RepID=E3GZI1_METFV|nr:hypothetical protein [Methanothermus fervidus]ADP77713.1 conserved hypothetical protein [Methanothermus fervidus DSM 2088]